MKIHLVMLGKTRRPEIRALLDDYLARIGRFADVQLTELREDSAASLRKLALDSAATVVLLDDAGKASNVGAIRQVAGRNARPRSARNRLLMRRRGRFSRSAAPPRHAKAFAFFPDVLARTRPRHARRAALPRLRHPRGPSLPEIKRSKHKRATLDDLTGCNLAVTNPPYVVCIHPMIVAFPGLECFRHPMKFLKEIAIEENAS